MLREGSRIRSIFRTSLLSSFSSKKTSSSSAATSDELEGSTGLSACFSSAILLAVDDISGAVYRDSSVALAVTLDTAGSSERGEKTRSNLTQRTSRRQPASLADNLQDVPSMSKHSQCVALGRLPPSAPLVVSPHNRHSFACSLMRSSR